MTPLTAAQALESSFLEARSKLLDLAAILDRVNRGRDTATAVADPRMERIRQALQVLLEQGGGRAERIQQVFSLPYDAGWDKPKPR